MLYKVIVKPEAETDIEEAINWYEYQRVGLGVDFLLHFEEAVSLIRRNPLLYIKVLLNFRRALIHKFPYAIYYSVDKMNKVVDVFAVLNTARNPEIFTKRLKL